MKTFIAHGRYATQDVLINGKLLSPERSQAIINHSPDGFLWAYGGSGPAQLALALLLEYTNNEMLSKRFYQRFKRDVIANLPCCDFVLPAEAIGRWLTGHWVLSTAHHGEQQRGRIKSWNEHFVFVVYKCNEEWDRFQDYTGCATDPADLILED